LGRKREIQCQQVEAWLVAYLKEGLSRADSRAVEGHLATCDACTRSLRDARTLEAELRLQAARHQPVLAPEASARIQERVYKRMGRGLIVQRVARFAGGVAALVAVVVLVVGALALWHWMRPAGEDMSNGEETIPVAIGTETAYVPPSLLTTGDDRINVLLLGIDRREGKGWGYRTDAIIVATVDPTAKTTGILSIPRDLQVTIPGIGKDRINTVNVYGYLQHYPGGGPALLKRTVEANFGISIDYYVMVDYDGFKQIVDALGGIDVDVPRMLHDERYPDPKPDDPHAYKTVHLDPGWQHMNGERALEYARSRMGTSDADRARRQQQILLAIHQRALNTNLIPEFPELVTTIMDMVNTDMTLEAVLELAWLMPHIDTANPRQVVLEEPLVYSHRPEVGAAVQLPRWGLIKPVIADLFNIPEAAIPTGTPPSPK
jgi:LCP family protein required for cell wall assembly